MTRADALLAEASALRARAEAIEAEGRRLLAQEHDDAIIEALLLYSGSDRARSIKLAAELLSYAANAWPRESGVDELPDSKPSRRRALHRILRSRQGKTLCDRQIRNIVKVGNREPVTFPKQQCESQFEADERQTHERV